MQSSTNVTTKYGEIWTKLIYRNNRIELLKQNTVTSWKVTHVAYQNKSCCETNNKT